MARIESDLNCQTYRIFVTDYLKSIGRFRGPRYIEYLADLKKPVETRTGNEIIDHIKDKLSQFGGE
jgi:hypothetical protein